MHEHRPPTSRPADDFAGGVERRGPHAQQSDLFQNAANVNATHTVNLSSEALSATWRLRVNDFGFGSTGRIDRWSAVF
jgi:subtilisin-like proprotein convertase family protein